MSNLFSPQEQLKTLPEGEGLLDALRIEDLSEPVEREICSRILRMTEAIMVKSYVQGTRDELPNDPRLIVMIANEMEGYVKPSY